MRALTRTREDDLLGKLALTDAGIYRRDQYVLQTCRRWGAPVACVIGGGYSQDIDALARRHSLVHRAATEVSCLNPDLPDYRIYRIRPHLRTVSTPRADYADLCCWRVKKKLGKFNNRFATGFASR